MAPSRKPVTTPWMATERRLGFVEERAMPAEGRLSLVEGKGTQVEEEGRAEFIG
jgi:hypothetical protein